MKAKRRPSRRTKCPKAPLGFTTIELMIALAVIAIAAAIAAPAVSSSMPNYRAKAAVRDVMSGFQRAKMEAAKRNENVVIAFTAGAYDPPEEGSGSYQIFVDDGSGAGGVQGDLIRNGTEPLLINQTMPQNVSLYLANFSGTQTAGYNPRGLPLQGRIGRVEIRNNKSRCYQVVLSVAGFVRLQTGRTGGGAEHWDP